VGEGEGRGEGLVVVRSEGAGIRDIINIWIIWTMVITDLVTRIEQS
jgi:hypothetical protein